MPKYLSKPILVCAVTLNPKQAIAFRELGVGLEYRCPDPECNQQVIVVSKRKDKDGVTFNAHFQHLKKNPTCRYSKDLRKVSAASDKRGFPAKPELQK